MTNPAIAPGTIAHEAIQFLRRNPGEVSTTGLAEGIGRPTKRLAQQLAPALNAGLLSRRTAEGFALWSLGHVSDARIAPPAPTPFEQDRQRVTSVSAKAMPSVFAYADQRKAAPFSVAVHSDGRILTERHGRIIAEFTAAEVVILRNAMGA